MEKELSLTELYALLSEGKKVSKASWVKGEYIYVVDNVLRDHYGRKYYIYSENDWVEYKKPTVDFDDFVYGKFFKTNLTGLKDIIEDDSFVYEVVCKKDEYVVLENCAYDAYAFILFKNEYEELKADIDFFIEEAI